MRKWLLALALVFGSLVGQVGVAAANSPAQMVTCPAIYCFSPTTITVPVGSSVAWTNQTTTSHTATADSGTWTTPTVAPGGSATVTFATAGTFAYHCNFHSFMHGTIVVTGLAQSGGGPAASGGPGAALPIGAGLVLLGLGVLAAARLRRQRLQGVRETVDE
jgi:predicted CxxxxCH...CXXCH cytochrome family protein